MRLIDADAIEIDEKCTFSGKRIKAFLDAIPTAYDVDKVVEQMEKDTELAYNRYMDCSPNAPQSVVARYSTQYQERARCLEIVKSGGID